jgi:two-component system copper resistance phosphate regulon response regulator CusR
MKGSGLLAPRPGQRMRVLVVEDQLKLARALEEGLQAEQYEVVVESSGEAAFFRLSTEPFDLTLLDLSLPGRDGLEVLSAIRARQLDMPVLILTARDSLQDRVTGLDRGADDYLVKPFAFAELLARMRALLRRGSAAEVRRLLIADLEMNLLTRKVTRDGRPVDLTPREFELLEYLLRCQAQVVTRDMIARHVWRQTERPAALRNVIDVHIARLRRKVDTGAGIPLIHTVRGVGFTLQEALP